LLHRKSVISLALACLLLVGAGGCGSGGETPASPQDRAGELTRWFKGVEAAVADMEQKQRDFTRFKVSKPPPKSALVKLSPAGAKVGEKAAGAADQLDAATDLTDEEATGLYCYFFAFYVDLESSPVEKEFELVIGHLVKAKLPTPSAADEVSKSADALREAMVEAEKAGGRGPEVAAAGVC
jgi:hypothetical protein